jgi:hypothetical protein
MPRAVKRMRDEQPSAARFSTHLVDQRSKPRMRSQPIEKRFDRQHSYLPVARLICLLDQIHRSVVLTEAEMHDGGVPRRDVLVARKPLQPPKHLACLAVTPRYRIDVTSQGILLQATSGARHTQCFERLVIFVLLDVRESEKEICIAETRL